MRPIAISLSPNIEFKDVLMALKLLFSPWQYINGRYVKLLEQWFRQNFNVSCAVSFSSGRGALFAILKSLDIKIGDEVIIQAFTCAVLADAILATGAILVYADIKDDLTIDTFSLKNKITKKTKAIIVQHTFGIPADLEQVSKVVKKYKIPIIEDCAHIIGESFGREKKGLYSVASFFSFGRDKAFSSVFGGVAISDDKNLAAKIREFQKKQRNQSICWTMQQLFHPIAFFIVLPLYNFLFIGKILIVILQKMKLLSFPVSEEEKKGKISTAAIKKMPNALAFLALYQLKRIKEFNQKRAKISAYYLQELQESKFTFPYTKDIPFLRFPVLTNNREEILSYFKKKGIYLGKWYSNIVDPEGTDFKKIFYFRGSCPNAEYIAKKILNLPTYPAMKNGQVYEIVQLLKKYAEN